MCDREIKLVVRIHLLGVTVEGKVTVLSRKDIIPNEVGVCS